MPGTVLRMFHTLSFNRHQKLYCRGANLDLEKGLEGQRTRRRSLVLR